MFVILLLLLKKNSLKLNIEPPYAETYGHALEPGRLKPSINREPSSVIGQDGLFYYCSV